MTRDTKPNFPRSSLRGSGVGYFFSESQSIEAGSALGSFFTKSQGLDLKEKWVSVFDGIYAISESGVLKRTKETGGNSPVGKIIKPWKTEKGYLKYYLSINRSKISVFCHKLVAMAFIGPRPNGLQINHKDGNKLNNHFSNLEYVTPLENHIHSAKLGLHNGGFIPGGLIEWAFKLKRSGLTLDEISRITGISRSYADKVLKAKARKEITVLLRDHNAPREGVGGQCAT